MDNVDAAPSFSRWAIEAGRSSAAEAFIETHGAGIGGPEDHPEPPSLAA
jgi:hypothetical protein